MLDRTQLSRLTLSVACRPAATHQIRVKWHLLGCLRRLAVINIVPPVMFRLVVVMPPLRLGKPVDPARYLSVYTVQAASLLAIHRWKMMCDLYFQCFASHGWRVCTVLLTEIDFQASVVYQVYDWVIEISILFRSSRRWLDNLLVDPFVGRYYSPVSMAE